MGAVCGHAAAEGVFRQQGVAQVVRLHRLAEHLAVGADAADGDAAEVDAVVALGATDQPRFFRTTLQAPVGAGHLQ